VVRANGSSARTWIADGDYVASVLALLHSKTFLRGIRGREGNVGDTMSKQQLTVELT
jgi:hypothetical protein